MKKILALVLAVLMIISMVACAAKPEEQPTAEATKPAASATEPAAEDEGLPYEGVELNFWFPAFKRANQEYWDARLQQFTAETGATVVTTIVPWEEMSTKYMSGFMSGEGADVFYTTNELLYDMIDAGFCLELSPYFTQEEVDNQLYWSVGNMMGGQYVAPFLASVDYRGTFFNMDLLKAAGVDKAPETYEEMVAAAKKVQDAGVCEYAFLTPVAEDNASPLATFFPILWSCGGDIISADATKATLDTPEALAACQYLYDFANTDGILSKDAVTMDVTTVAELFAEGKVAMCVDEVNQLMDRDGAEPFPFEWTGIIALNDGAHDSRTFASCDTMAVNADSKNLDAAVALLKFLISTESREDMMNVSGMIQMNADMVPYEYAYDFVARDMGNIGTYGKVMPVAKGMSTMTEVVKTYEQLLVLGEITPEEACKAMQAACQTAIDG